MQFIRLTEIMDMKIGQPIYINASSINSIKVSQFMGSDATLIMAQNDCIWVKETPDTILGLIKFMKGLQDESIS